MAKSDLTGKRSGRLIAIRPTEKRKNRCVVWECKCLCGNVCYVDTHDFNRGRVASCGCHIKNDLTNKRFGRLVALRPVKKNRDFIWECKCDCGNLAYVQSSSLVRGDTRSCGCLAKEILKTAPGLENSLKTHQKLTIDGVRLTDFGKKKLKNNTSGYTGVYKKRNKWVAELIVKGKRYRKFGFDTPEDAYFNGRLKLEEEYFPEKFKEEYLKRKKSDSKSDLKSDSKSDLKSDL